MSADMKTPLAKVRGHGAAGSGVHHHIAARVSAIILALVTPIFLYGLLTAFPDGYDGLVDWLSGPVGAFSAIAFIGAGLYHGRLGMNEVILDYLGGSLRTVCLLANTLACLGFGLIGILSILKIWLGA